MMRFRPTLVDQLQNIAMLGVLFLAAAVPGTMVIMTWFEQRAELRHWTIDGPPCPVVDKPSSNAVSHRRNRLPKTFTYGGATFTRSFGAVSCAGFPEPGLGKRVTYPVCQFNNPGAVTVETDDGAKVIFQPEVGRPATVTVHHGRAACVQAGWFVLKG